MGVFPTFAVTTRTSVQQQEEFMFKGTPQVGHYIAGKKAY